MRYEAVDISTIPEVGELNMLFREASMIDQPSQMLQHFGRWWGRKRPTDLFASVSRRGLGEGEYKVTRLLTRADRDGTSGREPANPWRDWDTLETLRGGLIGEIIAREEPQLIRNLEAGDDPHYGPRFAGMRSAMAIPQYHEGRATNWAISFYHDENGPSESDLVEAMLDTSLLGMATRNLVSKRQADLLNRELTHQFEQIANIQRSLLPQRLPAIPGLEIATSYLTSDRAGGDYYDFFPFPDGSWGILIADVSGHGPAAATVMAMLRAILHCYAGADFSPSSVMRYTNDKLVASNLDGSFVTALFAVYDPASSVFAWSRCGHMPPALKSPGAEGVRELRETGVPPLGIVHGLEPDQESIVIQPGETIVLYTDGITEAFSPAGEMFGVRGLVGALERCSGKPDCVVDSVHGALYQHTGIMDRDDDQTLVALQRVGPL